EFGEGVGADAGLLAENSGRGSRWGEAEHLAAVLGAGTGEGPHGGGIGGAARGLGPGQGEGTQGGGLAGPEIEAANASGNTPVVFVHGLWLLPSSWDRWADHFEEAGYGARTPAWPEHPDARQR